MRIIADHIRAATFIIGDPKGISPSNIGAGYVLRRLIRRAVRHGKKLQIDRPFLEDLAAAVVTHFEAAYPELRENAVRIFSELRQEEEKFRDTLRKGEAEFTKMLPGLLKNPKKVISGRLAFKLYDTFGFPIELTEELAREHEMTVDKDSFNAAYKKHQEISRGSNERVFKGGLADHSEQVTAYHTATHLLHKALRIVLGNAAAQRGSNITAERLRFDFSHTAAMTPEEKSAVERIVNEQIQADLPVSFEVMPLTEAMDSGAIAIFGEKYEDRVKVYSIGDFSKEVCGGPHVSRTGTLGTFRIIKEQSSSAGVRRIRAVLEKN